MFLYVCSCHRMHPDPFSTFILLFDVVIFLTLCLLFSHIITTKIKKNVPQACVMTIFLYLILTLKWWIEYCHTNDNNDMVNLNKNYVPNLTSWGQSKHCSDAVWPILFSNDNLHLINWLSCHPLKGPKALTEDLPLQVEP